MLRYSKDGALSGPEEEHGGTSPPSLHLHQAGLVHVNPLLLQQVPAETEWRRS